MSDTAVFRKAPATPGPLNDIYIYINLYLNVCIMVTCEMKGEVSQAHKKLGSCRLIAAAAQTKTFSADIVG